MKQTICPKCQKPSRRLKHSLLCGCGFKLIRSKG
ncbi:hypothetical protein GGQ95_003443 [Anoxybacillus rupiensis]|nr:hypothetical protein [Anoxybacillus rupiensis]